MRPPIWQLVRNAIQHFGREVSYSEIKQFVWSEYPDVNDFYVFELKLGRGGDVALGQILRYMGWVSRHLSTKHKVFGVFLAAGISEKLRYAATQVPQVRLMEYELRFAVKPADLSTKP